MRALAWISLITLFVPACSDSSTTTDAAMPDIAVADLTPTDGTVPPDGASSACTFQTSGRVCGGSAPFGCPSEDGCNWCACGGDFGSTTSAACTQVFCTPPDMLFRPAGAPAWPRCRNQADCPDQFACIFDAGCGETEGRCSWMQMYCKHEPTNLTICDCNGQTQTITVSSCAPDRRFAHRGPC